MLKHDDIALRQVAEADIDLFIKWFNDPVILKFLSVRSPKSAIEERAWLYEMITKRKKTDLLLVVDVTQNNKTITIGTCGIHKIDHQNRNAEISVIIGEVKEQSKGYGTKVGQLLLNHCFNNLNLNRVYTGAYSFNKASIRTLKKIGFTKEGCLRQAIFKNGKFYDIILFGILKNDY